MNLLRRVCLKLHQRVAERLFTHRNRTGGRKNRYVIALFVIRSILDRTDPMRGRPIGFQHSDFFMTCPVCGLEAPCGSDH